MANRILSDWMTLNTGRRQPCVRKPFVAGTINGFEVTRITARPPTSSIGRSNRASAFYLRWKIELAGLAVRRVEAKKSPDWLRFIRAAMSAEISQHMLRSLIASFQVQPSLSRSTDWACAGTVIGRFTVASTSLSPTLRLLYFIKFIKY